MKRRSVIFSPEAFEDLSRLHDFMEDRVGVDVSQAWIERLESWCRGFETAGERGHLRNDIRPGLRIIGFERRVTVAFIVDDTAVTFLRFFYAGRDWERAL